MFFIAQFRNSAHCILGEGGFENVNEEYRYEKDFFRLPMAAKSLSSKMTSNALRQYGSVAGRNSSFTGTAISKDQARLFFRVKDLHIKMQINAAVIRRRQFVLFVLFDIFFTTFLWILIKLIQEHESFQDIAVKEILHYSFKTSLFDVIVVTYFRGSVLYLFVNANARTLELLIFVSTFINSSFLFYKIFSYENLCDNSIVVGLLIPSFTFAWIEMFLFDYRIFLHIRNLAKRGYFKPESHSIITDGDTEFQPNIRPRSICEEDDTGKSDAELDALKAEEIAYIKKGMENLLLAFDIIFSEGGWKKEIKNENGDIVESKETLKGTKVFRFKGNINAPPLNVMIILYDEVETQTTWNKTVLECKVIKEIDEHTDILYTLAASKGPVSSRDFVVLRHRGAVGQSLVIGSLSIETPLVPTKKSYIRGENGPGCFLITPMADNASWCEFQWLMNTNLKGWIPQKAVDNALSSVMINFVDDLRNYSETFIPVSIPNLSRSSHKFSIDRNKDKTKRRKSSL